MFLTVIRHWIFSSFSFQSFCMRVLEWKWSNQDAWGVPPWTKWSGKLHLVGCESTQCVWIKCTKLSGEHFVKKWALQRGWWPSARLNCNLGTWNRLLNWGWSSQPKKIRDTWKFVTVRDIALEKATVRHGLALLDVTPWHHDLCPCGAQQHSHRTLGGACTQLVADSVGYTYGTSWRTFSLAHGSVGCRVLCRCT